MERRRKHVGEYATGEDYWNALLPSNKSKHVMQSNIAHCDLKGDYSNTRPRLVIAKGGRLSELHFQRSPAAEWNSEQFFNRNRKRGICQGFSFSSRRRMLNHLNSLSVKSPLPAFVTLTLPDATFNDSVTEYAKRAKVYLDAWLKRLRRVCPTACAFWRMEWQTRKSGLYEGKLVPHFHLMIWGLPVRDGDRYDENGEARPEFFVDVDNPQLHLDFLETLSDVVGRVQVSSPKEGVAWVRRATEAGTIEGRKQAHCVNEAGGTFCYVSTLKQSEKLLQASFVADKAKEGRAPKMSFADWCALSWYHVVASGDRAHFSAGTSVEHVRSFRGVLSYCSKYMAKLGDSNFLTGVPVGRQWGIFNRSLIPWAELLQIDLTEDEGVRLRRVFRRYLEHQRGRKVNCPYGVTLYAETEVVFRWLERARPPDVPF